MMDKLDIIMMSSLVMLALGGIALVVVVAHQEINLDAKTCEEQAKERKLSELSAACVKELRLCQEAR